MVPGLPSSHDEPRTRRREAGMTDQELVARDRAEEDYWYSQPIDRKVLRLLKMCEGIGMSPENALALVPAFRQRCEDVAFAEIVAGQ
jgi:hypothetical protein